MDPHRASVQLVRLTTSSCQGVARDKTRIHITISSQILDLNRWLPLIYTYKSYFELTSYSLLMQITLIYAKCHCSHLIACNTMSNTFVTMHGLLFRIPNLEPVHCGRCRQIPICLRINSLGHHVCSVVDLVLRPF